MSQSDNSQNRRWDKWMYNWTGSGNHPQRTKHLGNIDRCYSVWFLYCVSVVSLMSQSDSIQDRRWDKWVYYWSVSGNHPQRTKHLGNIDRWYSVWFLYCVSVVFLMSQSDSSQNSRWDKWMDYWTGSGNHPQRTKHLGNIDRWYSVWFLYCVSIVSLMSQSDSSQNRRWDKWMDYWTGSGNHPQRAKHIGNIDRCYSVWFLYRVSVVLLMSQSDNSQNRRLGQMDGLLDWPW